MRTSDLKRLGEAWTSVTSKIKGYTDEEVRELCHSKDHDCAVTVNHPKWGLGKPIYESHAIPTDEGYVEWYDVQFKHGIEEKVPAEDMEIVVSETHNKKKKTEDASNDQEDDGEGMDKVDPKAVKKKFKDRKDKDIDNDGDVDSSDEYLHKRRQAVSKAMKKDKPAGNNGEKKAEISKIGEATEKLLAMIESAAKQQKSNATKPEGIMDKESPKSKEFANAHKKSEKKYEDDEEDGHDITFKAGQVTKAKSGKRPQDNQAGDTKIIKSTEAPAKGQMEAYVDAIRRHKAR